MKRNITFLAYVLTLNFIVQQANGQVEGDYRSKMPVANNDWFNAANWEVFTSGAWQNASTYPTSADGVITIMGTDSLVISTTAINIDQVHVTTSAKLTLSSGTFNLDNGTGEDISVDGRLYFLNTAILNGAGSIRINSTGWIMVRNSSRLQHASTVNDGFGEFFQSGIIQNGTFTNNGTVNWLRDFIFLNTATFINNNNLNVFGSGLSKFMNSAAGQTGTFTNSATGTLYHSVTGLLSFSNTITFNNAGTIKGLGTLQTAVVGSNTGNISPGNNGPGLLTVNPQLISGRAVTLNMDIVSSTTPGTGHDKINIDGSTNVNIATVNLVVNDNPTAPLDTYTLLEILNTTFPVFTGGSFNTVTKPSNYDNPVINPLTVTIEKLSALPVTWGSFTATQNNGRVALNWSTLQEINVSHFVVEHSTDGQKYNSIGTVTAVGNSNAKNSYSFVHATPQHNGRNFYRILEVDFDGKAEHSVVRTVKLGDNGSAAIAIRSNPVQNGTLLVESDLTNASAIITSINGAVLKEIRLHQGINNIDVVGLPAGIYTFNVFDSKSRIFSGRFVKK